MDDLADAAGLPRATAGPAEAEAVAVAVEHYLAAGEWSFWLALQRAATERLAKLG